MKDYDMSQLRIKKAEVFADNITLKALKAQDFKAVMNIDENMNLNVDNYHLHLQKGMLTGILNTTLITKSKCTRTD